MKKLLLLLAFTIFAINAYAQEAPAEVVVVEEADIEDSIEKKKESTWQVGLYGGLSLLQSSDLTSFDQDGKFESGYNVNLMVTKQLGYGLGLAIQGDIGQTNQSLGGGEYNSETEYYAVSLIGDVNLTSFLGRIGRRDAPKWAVHAYAGGGMLGYETTLGENNAGLPTGTVSADINPSVVSLFAQVGVGLRRKLTNAFDVELKGMYFMTGDDEFDGSDYLGLDTNTTGAEEDSSDEMINVNLGLVYKIAANKDRDSRSWRDPFATMNAKSDSLVQLLDELGPLSSFCKVDADNDGVCDEVDKQLDTPEGARIDGSGIALDVDNDTVIDLYDQCITVPGIPENDGCPSPIEIRSIDKVLDIINSRLKGIEFEFNKDVIRPVSYLKLDSAASVIKQFDEYTYIVEGHTDAAGGYDYNLDLSRRRAESVVQYLTNKGVKKYKLRAVGKGESELLLAQCNPASKCSDEENEMNRRVIFIPGDMKVRSSSKTIERIQKINASNNPLEQYENQQKFGSDK